MTIRRHIVAFVDCVLGVPPLSRDDRETIGEVTAAYNYLEARVAAIEDALDRHGDASDFVTHGQLRRALEPRDAA